ncbi:MAG TPA: HypC/HybG/HupF family hydrogenase formation chaperone [Caldisericia bacterium]|nr:HypC/HybG/HupF family hydrogenase formation chaperone [Caldisericia bacterium]HPF48598.1 HypC/HybG/HupF family hydrogenase formation chaperone [Caldisericia bacterium]HPI83742.1 HypC/HybG/HupF family hydrogenase formation chaperone [Caldisericia bacterium]HPQ93053.1 HypC/HybG/HupF family hydrogenase formation chaperone [Caldisericia bacterium]HRV75114.1 HypC/HybG/HupF family hydrogenase formation chaperone [Caldisericia bacterium]
MCLAIPARLVEKKDNAGVVELGGVRRDIRLDLLPDAKIGDFVLLHTGFAIEIVEEQTAKDMLETIDQAFGDCTL